MPASGPARRRRLGRGARWALAAAVLALGGALISGYPQKSAAEWAIARSTGLIAEVEWGGLLPDLRVKRLDLYATPDAYKKRSPLLTALNIKANYSALAGARKVDRVSVGLVIIECDPNDPALRELPFLKSGADDAPEATFIPRRVSFDAIALRLHDEAGMFFLFDEFAADVDLEKPGSPAISVRARGTRVVWDSGDAHLRLEDVDLDGAARIEEGRLTWRQTIESAGVFRLAFDASGPISGDLPQVEVKVSEAALRGDRLAEVLESIASPLRFAEFQIESALAKASLNATHAFSLSAAARIYAPRLPGATEPLYADAIHLGVEAKQDEGFRSELQVTFAKGQRATASLNGTADDGEARAILAGWSREQFIDAIPPAFRESVAGLSFDAFSSDANLKWTRDTVDIDARAESSGGGAAAAPISWTMKAHGPRSGGQGIEGTAEARLGDRRVRASAHYEGTDHYVAEATIEQVQIAPWVSLFAGAEAAAPFAGTIEGLVRAEAKGRGAPLKIRPEITLKDFGYNALKLDEITAKGAIDYAGAEGRAAVDDFRVEAPDGMTSAILTDWVYDTNTQRGAGAFALSADLNVLGQLMSEPDLIGSGAIEGRAVLNGSQVDADVSVASGDFGYGDLRSPYGTKLNGTGALAYNRRTGRGELRGLHATIGDGTSLSFSPVPFATDPVSAEGDVTLTSDLQVLAAMLWLEDRSQGILNGTATFRVADAALRADWKFGLSAPVLLLPNDAGSAEAVEFDGSGSYDGALSGIGSLRAAKLMAAGGSVLNVAGPILFDGDQMRIQQAKGELFRGSVRADVDVGVLKVGLPILLKASFDDADLAILTDEVKPPKTQLTGTARGTISVEYDAKGLHAFTFEAQAPAGLSVNRSLVEELLQSDTFLSGAGASVAEKAMDKLLGSAPQRPFDRGSMNVQLANEKITGLAVLESAKTKEYNGLNLRVTLDMDQSTLAEALKMLQEASVASIDP